MKHKKIKPRNKLAVEAKFMTNAGPQVTRKELNHRKRLQQIKLSDEEIKAINKGY